MPTIRTRAQWGARPPKDVNRITLPTPRLWAHHTGDDRQGDAAVRAHQNFHMDVKGWLDIAYSFLIGDDGTIFEGRGPGVAGGHTEGDNSRSHAICLLGNFEGHPATRAAIDSLVWLAQHGRDAGWWVPTLGGHRDAPGASTACPGRMFYAQLPAVRTRVAGTTPPPEDDDVTEEQLIAAVTEALDRQARLVRGITDFEVYLESLLDAARKASRAPTAAQVAAAVAAALPEGSVDAATVEAAVRRVFADAAT